MAFRNEAAVVALIAIAVPLGAAEFRYEARHDHWRKHGTGTLVVSDTGVAFEEHAKKRRGDGATGRRGEHRFEWKYADIQQLYLAPREMKVLTYQDNKWKLGADREQEFNIFGEPTFEPVYELLRSKLDQRFVAALADGAVKPLWELPVKRLGTIKGSQGVLVVGGDHIVYKTSAKEDSRTWRYRDIENISTSGPFDLTLVTYERAKSHYGNLKQFHFQLKQALDEERYDDLWRRLNQTKGLRIP